MTRALGTLLAACALLAPATAAAQRDFSRVEIATTRLADGLYVLEGAGGNMAVSIGEDAVFLVDDQYAPLTEKIVAASSGSPRRCRNAIRSRGSVSSRS